MPYTLLLLLACLMPAAFAAEKVGQPERTGEAVDAAATSKAEKRKQAAEWVRRCDKLKEDARTECLENVRAEIVERFVATPEEEPAGEQQRQD